MTDSPYVRLRPGAATWRDMGDDIVLLDGSTSTFLHANPTAGLLWKAIVAGTTRVQLVDVLLTTFDVDRATAGEAVDAFVEACRQRDLLA